MRFAVGFLLGAGLTLIPEFAIYLKLVQRAFYPVELTGWMFSLVWGFLFGTVLEASNSILKKEGARGLLRIGILLGVFIALFWIISTAGLL